MKVGDMVLFSGTNTAFNFNRRRAAYRDIEPDYNTNPDLLKHMGLIINGPRDSALHELLDHPRTNQWEVFWMYCNMTGWWDEDLLRVVVRK